MLKFYRKSWKKSMRALLVAFLLFSPLSALAKMPGDPSYSLQAPIWNGADAPAAWDLTTGSSDVVVAVIDSGVDILNPDLVDNIWQNKKEIAGNGIDDDNNGFVDDTHGWNFVEKNAEVRPVIVGAGADEEAANHGTVVAGLIGATGNNGLEGTGLSWQVKIMPIRAINNYGSGSYEDITNAVDYAVNNGAKIISMSFVGEQNDLALRASLRRAYDKGVVIVAAAGNNRRVGRGDTGEYPYYPICYDQGDTENWILGVTSLNVSLNAMSGFANFGECVDVLAPGEAIYSTELYLPNSGFNQEFGGGWQGTSFATPIVAGGAALIKAVHPRALPQEITNFLTATAIQIDATHIASLRGKLGFGKVDIGAAVKLASESATKVGNIINKNLTFLKNNGLYEYDKETGEVIFDFKAQDGKLLQSILLSNDNKASLIQRAPFYFVEIKDAENGFSREFPIGDVDSLEKKLVSINKIQRVVVEGEERLLAVQVGKNDNDLISYDLTGVEKARFKIKDKIMAWSAYGDTLAVARLDGTKVIARLYNLDGSLREEMTIRSVYGVDDLVLGNFWGGDSLQIVALLRKNKSLTKMERVVMEPASSSSLSRVVNNPGAKTKWRIYVSDLDTDGKEDFLTYRLDGGNFEFLSGKGELLDVWTLPKF